MTPWSWYLDIVGLVMVAGATAILTWLAAGERAAVWRERAVWAERLLRRTGTTPPAPLPDDGIVILPGLWGEQDTVPLPSTEETAVLARAPALHRHRRITCGRSR